MSDVIEAISMYPSFNLWMQPLMALSFLRTDATTD